MCGRVKDVHVTCNARIAVGIPRSSQAGLSLKDAELVEAQDLAQATSHCDARLSGADHGEGIVGVGSAIRIDDMANLVDPRSHVGWEEGRSG